MLSRDLASRFRVDEVEAVAPQMNVYPKGWDFNERTCPCDAHFVDYLKERDIRDKTVFHFGTGLHHLVGIGCHELNNAVMAITASVDEINSYRDLMIERPELGRTYRAYFGDIYLNDPRLLPAFDIVFLPHLCEFTPSPALYGQTNDRGLLELLAGAAKPGALFVFYSRSRRFKLAEPLVREWAHDSKGQYLGDYKTLTLYRSAER